MGGGLPGKPAFYLFFQRIVNKCLFFPGIGLGAGMIKTILVLILMESEVRGVEGEGDS